MQRSWAYLFYDVALFAVMLLPLAIGSALAGGRRTAVLVYTVCLAIVIALSLLVTRFSKLSLRGYWRSLEMDTES